MSDVLEWNYESGGAGDLLYPMNGTGDLNQEGYGQFLPIAAASYAGADSVTVMPASSYNAANCEKPGNVSRVLVQGLDYDNKKADFLEQYLEQPGIEVDGISSREMMEQEGFWNYLADTLENNSREEIRDQSPLPDWMAKKSVDASVFLDSASEIFPVSNQVFEVAQGYQGSDLYLPMQAAEASVARDRGMNGKLGISSEEPFDNFTLQETDFPAFRSTQPLGLSGDDVVPYAERSNPDDQVLIRDSPQDVLKKISGANQDAMDQVEDIARQLDDEIMEGKLA